MYHWSQCCDEIHLRMKGLILAHGLLVQSIIPERYGHIRSADSRVFERSLKCRKQICAVHCNRQ